MTTPEPATTIQITSAKTHLKCIWAHIHGQSSVELRFQSGILCPEAENLPTGHCDLFAVWFCKCFDAGRKSSFYPLRLVCSMGFVNVLMKVERAASTHCGWSAVWVLQLF
ncbi:hypothetical protein AVEN_267802-1 [Araneus ventricosus]|uniref:Uncharacterized protein n=1 Tax=Araneus ventricosus TaxID=182803 RepID=A0A4Y2D548_ARAVE|nr:hypothetical protein AVEN_267802-1 [Araneus ventricosus]